MIAGSLWRESQRRSPVPEQKPAHSQTDPPARAPIASGISLERTPAFFQVMAGFATWGKLIASTEVKIILRVPDGGLLVKGQTEITRWSDRCLLLCGWALEKSRVINADNLRLKSR
jgi:hypothetical protein